MNPKEFSTLGVPTIPKSDAHFLLLPEVYAHSVTDKRSQLQLLQEKLASG